MRDCLFFLFTFLFCASASHNILSYGAVPGNSSNDAAVATSGAITAAFLAANSSSDKTVLIPEGYDFYIFEVQISDLHNVVFTINGNLFVSNDIDAWPTSNPRHVLASLYIGDSTNIVLNGTGTFDGQGYDWWWYVIVTTIDNRPMLMLMEHCADVQIYDITFKNSPQYHLDFYDMKNVHIHDIDIIVDVIAQKQLLRDHGHLNISDIPTFPLNTDGIDPRGKNFLIENVYIENFDDAVAVKPSSYNPTAYASCSEDMVIRNSTVRFSVGMTIGSVPPSDDFNCVRNITFDNIEMDHPIKGIYVKTNPGDSGSGIISGVQYSNMIIKRSLWYPIWIGPQQQRQPGTAGTGCSFFYPIVDKCPTQPRVPIENLSLINITLTDGVTMPGVIICNSTRPCKNFLMENVQNSGLFLVQDSYDCQNISNFTIKNSSPVPHCITTDSKEHHDSPHLLKTPKLQYPAKS